jgi:hypothetical protein
MKSRTMNLWTLLLIATLLTGCMQPQPPKPMPTAPAGIPTHHLQPVQTGNSWTHNKWVVCMDKVNPAFQQIPLGFDSRELVRSNLPSKLTDANLNDFKADAKLRSEGGLCAIYLVDSIEATGRESPDPNSPVVKGIVGMGLGTYGIAITPAATLQNADTGLLSHELGHVFGLNHSWVKEDECDDTPITTRANACAVEADNVMSYCYPYRSRFTGCQVDKIRAAMYSLARSREITGLPVIAAAKIKSVVISDVPVICGE